MVIVLLDSIGKYTRVADAKRVKSWMEASANRSACGCRCVNPLRRRPPLHDNPAGILQTACE